MSKLLLLIILSSCSFFIKRIDTPLVSDTAAMKTKPISQGFCPLEKRPSIQLVGTDNPSLETYLQIVNNSGSSLDFLDHFALWNLLQLTSRPDQSSATSRFQVLVNDGVKSHYFDFFSEETDDQYPLLYGIEWVLERLGRRKSLESYADILTRAIGKNVRIGKELESFLIKNLTEIRTNPALVSFYFRGSDVLKENESAPHLNYQEILRHYRKAEKKQKIVVNTSLTSFVTNKGPAGACNYDFNLYDNSIFLIDKDIPVANLYGLAFKNQAFLASTSQKLERMESLKGLPLFKGRSKVRGTAVCMIEKDQDKIWTFSNQSRDPGQHLFHLFRYGLPNSRSTSDVDRLIRHSRHLFLSDPVRLVIESKRSSEEKIQNLLKLNLPIYNADKLGNIWGYTKFTEGSRFIIDDRNPGAVRCE